MTGGPAPAQLRNGRSFSEFLGQNTCPEKAPAPAPADFSGHYTSAAWRDALVFRLTNGPDEITIEWADDGLLHIHYRTAGGYRVRQVCTFDWLVERLLGAAV